KLNKKSKIFKTKTEVFIYFFVILLSCIVFIPITSVKAQSYVEIPVQTAYAMINNHTQYPNLLILDVREQNEYDENHLYNATLIPRLQIDSRISELMPYNDTEIIVYCLSGFRGRLASENLADNHNFTKIFNMEGGITAWIAAGYPVIEGNIELPSIDFSFTPFVMILSGTIAVLILYYKKRGYKKRKKD
ncbi:unnamed protein product, partial [marine sediment metagenome]